MKKALIFFSGFLFFLLTIIKFATPSYVERKILEALISACPKCQASVESVQVSLIQSEVILHKVAFVGDPNDVTTIDFRVDDVAIKVDLLSLASNSPKIALVQVKNLNIDVTDDDAKPAAPSEAKPGDFHWITQLPSFFIQETLITDSEFNYLLKKPVGTAKISVHKVNCKLSRFGTRKEISPRAAYFDVEGLLEKTGKVRLRGQEDLFGVPNQDKLFIEVTDLYLSDLNPFFGVEDGMDLSGTVKIVFTDLSISDGHMRGILKTKYSGLALKLRATTDTGPLKAAVTNFISSVTIIKDRPKENEPIPIADVSEDRKPGQGLIKFLLAGLKKSALKLVQADISKNVERSKAAPTGRLDP